MRTVRLGGSFAFVRTVERNDIGEISSNRRATNERCYYLTTENGPSSIGMTCRLGRRFEMKARQRLARTRLAEWDVVLRMKVKMALFS